MMDLADDSAGRGYCSRRDDPSQAFSAMEWLARLLTKHRSDMCARHMLCNRICTSSGALFAIRTRMGHAHRRSIFSFSK